MMNTMPATLIALERITDIRGNMIGRFDTPSMDLSCEEEKKIRTEMDEGFKELLSIKDEKNRNMRSYIKGLKDWFCCIKWGK